MPTLPEAPEPPAHPIQRLADGARRLGTAVGVDARVHTRALIFLCLAALGASMAPFPWAQVALISILGLALDWARTKR